MTSPVRSSHDEYRAALLAARRRMDDLDVAQARSIQREIATWRDSLVRAVRDTPAGPSLERLVSTLRLLEDVSADMTARIESSIALNTRLSFQATLGVWERAGRRALALGGLQPGLQIPQVTLAGFTERMRGGPTWRTALQQHGRSASEEAQAIVRQGILQGASPVELAQRLRPYVDGAESFAGSFHRVRTPDGDFTKIDLRSIPAAHRGAAQRMRANAERIAFTEIHVARAEAELQHFIADPLIIGIHWLLAPDRGSQVLPDICDALAKTDFYGMGPGAYPLNRVPPVPHPHDRCERMPIERDIAEASQPKPAPPLRLAPARLELPRAGMLSDAGRNRVLQEMENLIRFTDRQSDELLPLLSPKRAPEDRNAARAPAA